MKKLLKPVALLAVLSLAATGCQKENIVEPSTHIQQNVSVHNITYNICPAFSGLEHSGELV